MRKKYKVYSGKYARSQYRVFAILRSEVARAFGRHDKDLSERPWLGHREICLFTCIPYRSLGKLLPKWRKLGYIIRREATISGVGDYEYCLQYKGREWLQNNSPHFPATYFIELRAWVNFVKPRRELMLSWPFNIFVGFINSRQNTVVPESPL